MSTVVSAPAHTLVADDHPALARLLGDFLASQPGILVDGIVYTGPAVLEFCATHPVDFLILDLGLPGMSGLEVLATLQTEFPNIRTLVFSALASEHVIRSALELGARGFVEKSASMEEISEAIKRVLSGQTYMGPAARSTVIRIMRNANNHSSLTTVELKVLRWLNQGVEIKEIAGRVDMSISGAYKMIDRIKTKIGAKTPTDLIFAGIHYGVTTAPEVEK